MFGLGKTRSRPAERNDVLRRLTALEDLLDLVNILAHRTLAEDGVVVLLPECCLPLDVTLRREGVRLPVIT